MSTEKQALVQNQAQLSAGPQSLKLLEKAFHEARVARYYFDTRIKELASSMVAVRERRELLEHDFVDPQKKRIDLVDTRHEIFVALQAEFADVGKKLEQQFEQAKMALEVAIARDINAAKEWLKKAIAVVIDNAKKGKYGPFGHVTINQGKVTGYVRRHSDIPLKYEAHYGTFLPHHFGCGLNDYTFLSQATMDAIDHFKEAVDFSQCIMPENKYWVEALVVIPKVGEPLEISCGAYNSVPFKLVVLKQGQIAVLRYHSPTQSWNLDGIAAQTAEIVEHDEKYWAYPVTSKCTKAQVAELKKYVKHAFNDFNE